MEHFRLPGFAFPNRVDPDFSQDERSGVRQHLQARQVVLKGLPVVQVDVEAQEVGRLGLQELCGGEIAEGAQQLRVFGFGGPDQFVEERGHGGGATPTDDVGGNFVGDAEGEDRWMSGATTGGVTNQFYQFAARLSGVEEALLAIPRHIDQKFEAVLMG